MEQLPNDGEPIIMNSPSQRTPCDLIWDQLSQVGAVREISTGEDAAIIHTVRVIISHRVTPWTLPQKSCNIHSKNTFQEEETLALFF